MRKYLKAGLIILSFMIFIVGCGGDTGDGGGGGAPTQTTSTGDSTAPTNTSEADFINSGSDSTITTSVTIAISATDDTGVTAYYLSESSTTPSASDSDWTTVTSTTNYSADLSFTLSSGDGTKTVYVWFKDTVGNVSGVVSDTIALSVASNSFCYKNTASSVAETDDGNDGTIDSKTTTTYAYNSNGNMVSWVRDDDTDNDGIVDRTAISEYTYNSNGYLLSYFYEHYSVNEIMGTVTKIKSTFTYTLGSDGKRVSSIQEQERDNDNDGTVDNRSIFTTTYDSDGKDRVSRISEYDNDNDGTVDSRSAYTYVNTYDSNSRLLSSVETKDGSSSLLFTRKNTYTYDGNRNWWLTRVETSWYGNSSNPKKQTNTFTYTYDSNGNGVSTVRQEDRDGAIFTFTDTTTYDSNDRMIQYRYESGVFISNILDHKMINTYTYIYANDSDVTWNWTLMIHEYDEDNDGMVDKKITTTQILDDTYVSNCNTW